MQQLLLHLWSARAGTARPRCPQLNAFEVSSFRIFFIAEGFTGFHYRPDDASQFFGDRHGHDTRRLLGLELGDPAAKAPVRPPAR